MLGFLLIDKPAGPTSHDVVDRVRALIQPLTPNLPLPKVGHAGTLDPFATGLLIVGVGRAATREFSKLSGLDKSYEAAFVLGATSDTNDRTGRIEVKRRAWNVERSQIEQAIQRFIGEIEQVPPAYAAIKIGGKKMYEAARQGKPIVAEPRRIQVYQFELLHVIASPGHQTGRSHPSGEIASSASGLLAMTERMPATIRVHISCSSGTYIRALARDLGEMLGVGAYVEELRRTRIGPFSITEAAPFSDLKPETLTARLLPIQTIFKRLHAS